MKLACKRISALLIALTLTLTALGNLAPAAFAEETESVDMAQTPEAPQTVPVTDSYVLNYSPNALMAEDSHNLPYMYTTPFMVDHTITYDNGTKYYSGGNFPEIFNLINTSNPAANGTSAYTSIAAYCINAASGMKENATYRRINLEDSTYYESGAAGKLRAVMLNAFPRNNVETIQEAANTWLHDQGQPEIVGLQSGEAILATQVAIWQLANADHYTVNSYYYGWKDLTTGAWSNYRANVIDTSAINQMETEHTAQNIESLFHYLCNLDAVDTQYDAVSEYSLDTPDYSTVDASDGTYTVTVTVNVNTTVGAGDTLTLSATCGKLVQHQTITAAGGYRFTFESLTDRVPVKLEINGYQSGGDVYLFDALGGRGASQTLVGYDDSVLPVHGEITVPPDQT